MKYFRCKMKCYDSQIKSFGVKMKCTGAQNELSLAAVDNMTAPSSWGEHRHTRGSRTLFSSWSQNHFKL